MNAAVRVAVPAAAVEATLAVKLALVAPAATTAQVGTVTPASELVIFTPDPPDGAGLLKLTVQVEAPGAVTEVGAHDKELKAADAAGAASICSAVDLVMPLKAAVRVAVPAAAVEPTLAVKLALVAPAATTTQVGTVTPASELVIFTPDPPDGAGPVKVTEQVEAPGAVTELGLQTIPDRLPEGGGPSRICTQNDFLSPFAEAVSVTVPEEAAGDTLSVKSALVALAGIVAEAGNDTSLLLLERSTPTPPLGAGPLKATVHVSESDAAKDDWLQDSVVGTGEMSPTNCAPHPDKPLKGRTKRNAIPRTVPANRSFDCAGADELFNIGRRWGKGEGKG
ncbi:MAG: hypothetical protein ACLGSD_10840 [Acidobacteriota bacterium]